MKKILVAFCAFMLMLGLSGAAGAYTIDYGYVAVGNEFTSPKAADPGSVTENFNAATAGPVSAAGLTWTWAGDGRVITGDISGEASAPMGVINKDATKYIAVPIDTDLTAPNSVTATLGGSYNYFGIWWGSVDYLGANNINNVLKFYSGGPGGTLVETITGAQAINPSDANGNQTAPGTNLYVNIHNLPFFDSFEMSSNRFAFEADNITVGVPEPGTLLLLGSGLLGLALAGSRRKFRK